MHSQSTFYAGPVTILWTLQVHFMIPADSLDHVAYVKTQIYLIHLCTPHTDSTHMKIPPLLFVCNGVNLHFDDPADPFILILSYHIILLWNYLSLLGTCSTLSMKSVFQPSLLGSITNVLTFQPKKLDVLS